MIVGAQRSEAGNAYPCGSRSSVSLSGCADAGAPALRVSALRTHSYRSRGLHSLQLRNLYRCFDRDRVLVVHNRDLRQRHDVALRRVFAFLGVSEDVRIAPEIFNEDRHGGRKHRLVSRVLRLSYLRERARMRALEGVEAWEA